MMNEINAAFKKDLKADDKYLNGVLYDPFALMYKNNPYYDSSYDEDSVYSFESLKYIRQKYSQDYVCKLDLCYRKSNTTGANYILSSYATDSEYYYVPKSYTNTIEILKNTAY